MWWRENRWVRAAQVRASALSVLADRLRSEPSHGLQILRMCADVATEQGLAGALHWANGRFHGLAEQERGTYRRWVEAYDLLSDTDLGSIADHIGQLETHPKISVVMPVYNAPISHLRAAIQSVQRQVYPNWELCIADDCSTNSEVRTVLAQFESDSRISVTFRDRNGHISAASNTALERATGEFVALLDQDDLLAPHALYMVAVEITENPDANIIYSDEDKITEAGERYDPYFKSDWNETLLRGQNAVSHLGVYRLAEVRAVGGFREGLEGSQDYDLALKISGRSTPSQIRHIPHVLYHWRAVTGSTAVGVDQKSYAVAASRRALEDSLDLPAEIVQAGMWHRVDYELADPWPRVSIVIPTKDRSDLLRTAIEGVMEKTDYGNLEVIVVDNESRELQTAEYLREISSASNVSVVRYDFPFNFAAMNNRAADLASGEVLLLMNNDIEVVDSDWLSHLVRCVQPENVGIAGPLLRYPDGRIQHGGVILGLGGVAGHAHRLQRDVGSLHFGKGILPHRVSAVTGACLTVKRDVYAALGGMDERFAVAFNDVDLCLRSSESGFGVVFAPHVELVHHESVSRGSDTVPARIDRFRREIRLMNELWGDVINNDPMYNPNLTLDPDGAYRLALPPRAKRPWVSTQASE